MSVRYNKVSLYNTVLKSTSISSFDRIVQQCVHYKEQRLHIFFARFEHLMLIWTLKSLRRDQNTQTSKLVLFIAITKGHCEVLKLKHPPFCVQAKQVVHIRTRGGQIWSRRAVERGQTGFLRSFQLIVQFISIFLYWHSLINSLRLYLNILMTSL